MHKQEDKDCGGGLSKAQMAHADKLEKILAQQRISRIEEDGSSTDLRLVNRQDHAAIVAQCDIANYEISKLSREIDSWKSASGLECGGDPDGVTPEAAQKYWAALESALTEAQDTAAALVGAYHAGTTPPVAAVTMASLWLSERVGVSE